MSVFPKNVLLKIVREAITSEYITVCDARLVCKAVRDDAKINFYFEQLKDLMRKWNIMREAVRTGTRLVVKAEKKELSFLPGILELSKGRILMKQEWIGGGMIVYSMTHSHKIEKYVIKDHTSWPCFYITEVYPEKRQKTSE